MTQKPFITNMTDEDLHFGYFAVGQGVMYARQHLEDPNHFRLLMDIARTEFLAAGIKLIYYCGFPDQYILVIKIDDTKTMMAVMERISKEFSRQFNKGSRRRTNPLTPQIIYHPILSSRMMYEMIRDIYDDTEYDNPHWVPFGGGRELLEDTEGYIDREALELATGIPSCAWKEMLKRPKYFTQPPDLPESYDIGAGYILAGND